MVHTLALTALWVQWLTAAIGTLALPLRSMARFARTRLRVSARSVHRRRHGPLLGLLSIRFTFCMRDPPYGLFALLLFVLAVCAEPSGVEHCHCSDAVSLWISSIPGSQQPPSNNALGILGSPSGLVCADDSATDAVHDWVMDVQ